MRTWKTNDSAGTAPEGLLLPRRGDAAANTPIYHALTSRSILVVRNRALPVILRCNIPQHSKVREYLSFLDVSEVRPKVLMSFLHRALESYSRFRQRRRRFPILTITSADPDTLRSSLVPRMSVSVNSPLVFLLL